MSDFYSTATQKSRLDSLSIRRKACGCDVATGVRHVARPRMVARRGKSGCKG
jgi:hypothetical protein